MAPGVCVLLGEKVKGVLHFEQQVPIFFFVKLLSLRVYVTTIL